MKKNNNANTTHMNNGSPSTPQHHRPRSRSKKQLPSDTDLFYIASSSFPIFGHAKNSTTFSISISVTNLSASSLSVASSFRLLFTLKSLSYFWWSRGAFWSVFICSPNCFIGCCQVSDSHFGRLLSKYYFLHRNS
jgi:hypothetical protein